MISFSKNDIAHWDRFYRANLLSCVTGYKSAMLVGTVNTEGMYNLALFQNIVHLGANPALIGLINRPREATPHTLANIEATRVFTLNSVHADFIKPAHQTSAKYPDGVSEFDAVGLTPESRDHFPAPFVAESLINIALQLEDIMPIPLNGTFLVIGSVKTIYMPDDLLQEDGYADLTTINAMCTLGLDGYAKPGAVQRFRYAKP